MYAMHLCVFMSVRCDSRLVIIGTSKLVLSDSDRTLCTSSVNPLKSSGVR